MASSRVEDKAEELVEDGVEAAKSASKRIGRVAGRAKDAAEDVLDEGRDLVEGALLSAKAAIRSNPITAVAVVAAVAYLWGRIRS